MSDETRTSEYPLPTSTLSKGDKVSVEEIERAFCVQVGTPEFQFACLQACSYIRQKLLERGLYVTVIQDSNEIRILTDPEASAYNQKRFNAEIRGAFRAHARNLGVDRSQLDASTLDKHDRSLEVQGRTLAAIRKAKSDVNFLKPNERVTPGLKNSEDD